jgi:hypothetical protein
VIACVRVGTVRRASVVPSRGMGRNPQLTVPKTLPRRHGHREAACTFALLLLHAACSAGGPWQSPRFVRCRVRKRRELTRSRVLLH